MAYNPQVIGWMVSFVWLLLVLTVWEAVWKGIALWKSGNNRQVAWFVCIFIFNTLGILPLIYLIWFQRGPATGRVRRSRKRRR